MAGFDPQIPGWFCPQTDRSGRTLRTLHPRLPLPDQRPDFLKIQLVVDARVPRQIRIGQPEERDGRAEPVLLEVNEGACQLDQAFVEGRVGTLALAQPERFQHLMRLVK